MKKLFLLLTLVGMIFTACDKDNDEYNGNHSNNSSVAIDPNNPLNKYKCAPNEILYISKSGSHIELTTGDGWGANLISNTYDGVGRLKFDARVTMIPRNAFNANELLEYIKMPDSITSIGDSAFSSCTSLTSVTIPASVTSIGSYAFSSCRSLTSVTIGNSVTSIGAAAFQGCNNLAAFYGKYASEDNRCLIIDGVLNSFAPYSKYTYTYTIPDSVTSIGDRAFYNCDCLGSVTIPNSVTSIGDRAFSDCSNLTKFTIPNSVTSIGVAAFSSCSSLTSVIIPDSVTSIEDQVFYLCSSQTRVTIPDCITSIGESAFFYCSSLTSIAIPNNVTLIGGQAFYSCFNLTSVYISDLLAWCKIDFSTSSANPLGNGANLYLNGELITQLTVPSDITEIKSYTFNHCNSLTNVIIPDSVTSIEDGAFSGCSSLTSVTIPNSVTSIGKSAFSSCDNLTSVTIPNSVISIGKEAFYNCSSLTSVYCKPVTPPTGGSNMFYRNASGRKIYVPTTSVDKYKAAQYWSAYSSYIIGYDF